MSDITRLIKAAKRTIRAEVTLVIVIIVISSWSIYALYKLAYHSDILSGLINFSVTKSSRTNSSEPASLASAQHATEGEPPAGDQHIGYYRAGSNTHQMLNYSQPDSVAQYRARLLQELMAGQQELYANLGSAFPNSFSGSRHMESRSQPAIIRQSIFADGLAQDHPQPTRHQLRQKLLDLQDEQMRARAKPTPPYQASPERPDIVGRVQVMAPAPVRRLQEELQLPPDTTDREAAESNNDSGESIVGSSQQQSDDTGQSSEEPEQNDSDPSSADESDTGDDNSQDTSSGEQHGESDDASNKESSGAIDDEVDRISEPSSGNVRHFQSSSPDDFVKDTVQFDDFLSNGAGSLAVAKSVPAGNQIARFEAPGVRQTSIGEVPPEYKTQDLQFDHNSPIVGSTSGTKSVDPSGNFEQSIKYSGQEVTEPPRASKKRGKKVNIVQVPEASDIETTDTKVSEKNLHDAANDNKLNREANREKRSAEGLIKSFRNDLSTKEMNQLSNRALGKQDPISSSESSPTAGIQIVSEKSGIKNKELPTNKERTMFSIADDHYPMPSYLTTNDSVLQELIDRRRLIDALNASQLPAPYLINEPHSEPKTAGSLHHIDHGLMLFPSAGELHVKKTNRKSASGSKHKGKHLQMKEKSKMSSTTKKGGHKGRKLDKEEKKFFKAKNFLGAKKGKKVSKGKGGAGGKKGMKKYKDKGYKKKGFKNVYHKEEWANKKSFFDEYRDKDFKKKYRNFNDKFSYANMKKYQAKDEKGAKKLKRFDNDHRKFDKGKWRQDYRKRTNEHKQLVKKKKKKTHEYER